MIDLIFAIVIIAIITLPAVAMSIVFGFNKGRWEDL